jgi:hypothetical protein
MNPGFHPEFRKARERIEAMAPQRHDPRARVTVEEVAAVWNSAPETGTPPRQAVHEQLYVSLRTADRYIARARAAGLIPDQDRGVRRRSNDDESRTS